MTGLGRTQRGWGTCKSCPTKELDHYGEIEVKEQELIIGVITGLAETGGRNVFIKADVGNRQATEVQIQKIRA